MGTVLSGKWNLDELLGWGGMATVYAGTHTRNRSRVAVKILHPEVARDPALKTRFLREGYVANSIKHPGIVRVFDDSAEDESAYLVMELLTGKTLKETWKKSGRSMPLKEIGRVISSILDVLAAAHAAGIVHRDIKPDNVFLTDEGDVKVLDFGIAFVQELRAAGEQVTTTGATLGTPAFMPPEQAHGKWALVDHRADIFSVGATARLLLTGRLAHDAEGATDLLIAAATKRVRPTLSVSPDLPPGIAAVVDRALGFEREERYPSAEEMKREWDRAVAAAIASGTESVPPPAPSPVEQPVSWGSKNGSESPLSASHASGSDASAARTSEPTSGDAGKVEASFTDGAVSRDAGARGKKPGRSVLPFAIVGLVAAAVVVIGVVALGSGDAGRPSSPAGSPSAAGSGAGASAGAEDSRSARPSASGREVSPPPVITTSSAIVAAASSSPAITPTTPRQPPPLGSKPATTATAAPACPPVFYGRDMNDQPEYRCCGKPCKP
ncbi:MAG: serine/threonine-protein kinase [Polyangiaceae bacterium]